MASYIGRYSFHVASEMQLNHTSLYCVSNDFIMGLYQEWKPKNVFLWKYPRQTVIKCLQGNRAIYLSLNPVSIWGIRQIFTWSRQNDLLPTLSSIIRCRSLTEIWNELDLTSLPTVTTRQVFTTLTLSNLLYISFIRDPVWRKASFALVL